MGWDGFDLAACASSSSAGSATPTTHCSDDEIRTGMLVNYVQDTKIQKGGEKRFGMDNLDASCPKEGVKKVFLQLRPHRKLVSVLCQKDIWCYY
ncbi:hypothetical protein U9M48_037576 [Paspalum notatum var. saurae]|uniref:Uncharacterized protein n=1 Tax=Paspalum notatum var. saurae TaxID=547442 RepID=A0AAQ3UF99_PASNO